MCNMRLNMAEYIRRAGDNAAATTWRCFKAKNWLIIALCVYSMKILHLKHIGLHIFRIFSCHISSVTVCCRAVAFSLWRSSKIVACPALPKRCPSNLKVSYFTWESRFFLKSAFVIKISWHYPFHNLNFPASSLILKAFYFAIFYS